MIDYIYKTYDSVTSTNDVAKQLINDYCPEGTIIYTKEQTDGRGRSGRVWQDTNGQTLATSLVLYPTLPQEYISCITLVAALSVRAAIKKFCGLSCKIKWPNDIICCGKKVCGILTERLFVEAKSAVIVGIGVNVKNHSFPEELEDKATSLLIELEEDEESLSREKLLYLIWDKFNEYYDIFIKSGNMAALVEEYNDYLVNVGRVVKAYDLIEDIEGVALGINEKGELLISTGQGKRAVASGEVTVRGLYSYV